MLGAWFIPSLKGNLAVQSPEAASAVGKLSYNQLVEKIINCKHSRDSNLVTEGARALLSWPCASPPAPAAGPPGRGISSPCSAPRRGVT